jgi:hypothetical protein
MIGPPKRHDFAQPAEVFDRVAESRAVEHRADAFGTDDEIAVAKSPWTRSAP